MTRKLLIPAMVVLALAGCTNDAAEKPAPAVTTAGSPPPWTEPAAYSFVVDRKCGDSPSEGRYQVTVTDGAVSATERVDGKTAEGEEEIEVPTLDGMLELAQTAIDDGADATTKFDGADGHPTSVEINRASDTDAVCFVISEYSPR